MGEDRTDRKDVLKDERKTLFLVDRSDSFIMYLRILLERMGFRVIPLKKWKLLREMQPLVGPDLVLLGSPVDGSDPVEALAALRSDGAAVPVILISSRDEDELGFDWRKAGFAGCLSRPINIFKLFQTLYDSIVFSSGEKRVHLRTPFRERVEVTRAGKSAFFRRHLALRGGRFHQDTREFFEGRASDAVRAVGLRPSRAPHG